MHNDKPILIARGVSEIGNAIRQVILALSILSVRDLPQDLYLAEVLETSGVLLIMLLSPFFIDRISRKKSLVTADVLCICNSIFLFFAASSNSLFGLLVGSFFTTFFSSFYASSLNAYVADSSKRNLATLRLGLSRIQLSILIGSLVGLVGTTATITHVDLKYFFLVDAFSFLFSTALLLRWAKSAPQRIAPAKSAVLDWLQGFQICATNSRLRFAIFSVFCGGVSYGIFESSSVVHITRSVDLSEYWVTATRALNRVGAIIALISIFQIQKRTSKNKSAVWIFSGGTMALISFFLMSSTAPSVFVLGSVFLIAGMSVINPALSAIVGATVDSSTSGRVYAFHSLAAFLGVLLGNTFMASTGVAIGTSAAFQVAGLIYMARIVFGFFAIPQNNR